MWIEPIFDRTISDIQLMTEKGHFQHLDMNRIEGNLEYIADSIGVILTSKTDWTREDLPNFQDWQRVLNNLVTVKEAWVVANIPDNPSHPINHYEKINIIERIEYILNNNIFGVRDMFFRCGTEAYAGSVIGVI